MKSLNVGDWVNFMVNGKRRSTSMITETTDSIAKSWLGATFYRNTYEDGFKAVSDSYGSNAFAKLITIEEAAELMKAPIENLKALRASRLLIEKLTATSLYDLIPLIKEMEDLYSHL